MVWRVAALEKRSHRNKFPLEISALPANSRPVARGESTAQTVERRRALAPADHSHRIVFRARRSRFGPRLSERAQRSVDQRRTEAAVRRQRTHVQLLARRLARI